jgi:dephospho-CoA kinase
VAKIFAALGVPVYHADKQAKHLMENSAELIQQVKYHFSEDAYENGKLNTRFLAGAIFQDKEKMAVLNGIVHPHTIKDANEWMQKQTHPYAIKEAALIFESGSQGEYDLIIGVQAPHPLRILRTMKRDKIEREKVLERMDNQLDERIKLKLCDIIIENNEQQLLLPQVLALHEKLMSMNAKRPHA